MWVIFVIAGVMIVLAILRYQVRGIPVVVQWMRKNYSAVQFRALEDLGGVFLYILDFRGKRAETIKKTGLPLEVTVASNKAKFYVEAKDQKAPEIDEWMKDRLTRNGFIVTPKETKIETGRFRKKTEIKKGYLITREAVDQKVKGYLDISAGGLKFIRQYGVVEKTGETVDYSQIIGNAQQKDPGNSAIIHEERSAAKEFLRMWAEAMRGAWQTLIIPIGLGWGIGAVMILLIIILTGHLR